MFLCKHHCTALNKRKIYKIKNKLKTMGGNTSSFLETVHTCLSLARPPFLLRNPSPHRHKIRIHRRNFILNIPRDKRCTSTTPFGIIQNRFFFTCPISYYHRSLTNKHSHMQLAYLFYINDNNDGGDVGGTTACLGSRSERQSPRSPSECSLAVAL